MQNKKFYITTTLPYVNDVLHIGHALEFTQADAYARYFRYKLGKENVFFNVGTDEHGLKILKAAGNEDPQKFVDRISGRFEDFFKLFHVQYDNFYRTTGDYHIKPVQEFWRRCLENGDIYKGKYEGWYCVSCEYYKTEKDLINGKCPDHDKVPVWLSEENYFFRLSKYQDILHKFFDENPDFIKPKSKYEEAKKFVKDGLTDISISRSKKTVPWGIEVPGDPQQVIYVWFDALINYVSAVGFGTDNRKFNEWWPVVQLCGYDNLRFQSIIWQAMLASARLPFSKKILIHSYVLASDGRKMSKTVGNTISPFDQVHKYNAEIVRYYLLGCLPTYTDSAYKEDDLINNYNANLADNYGNLLNRVIVLANSKGTKLFTNIQAEEDFLKQVTSYVDQIEREYEEFNLGQATKKINELITFGNKYINDQKPWEKSKDKSEIILTNLYYLLETVTSLYEPVIPESAVKAKKALVEQCPIILFKKIEK